MATVLTSLGELPVARGAAELTGRDAGHEDERGDTVAVRTRRGTPPRGPGGDGGSSAWLRCHSSSGSSRSTRLVMAESIQRQPESLKQPYR
jgi:hypothetical protein